MCRQNIVLRFMMISAIGFSTTTFGSSNDKRRWKKWSACSDDCGGQIQIRECLQDCDQIQLRIRSCSTWSNCTAFSARARGIPLFPSMKRIEIKVNDSWKLFCHPGWNSVMADAVCRQLYHTRAEATWSGRGVIEARPLACNASLPRNYCRSFEDTLRTCNESNQTVVVCEGNVSLSGTAVRFAGKVKVSISPNPRIVSVRGWDMRDANVTCHQLGFQSALAPFSKDVILKNTLTSIGNFNCTGNESSLVYCPYTTDEDVCEAASVTCKPDNHFTFAFRTPVKAYIGLELNISCRLPNDTPAEWYEMNGKKLPYNHGQLTKSKIGEYLFLIFKKVVPKDAGIYVCKGSKQQGIFVVYVLDFLSAPPQPQKIPLQPSAIIRVRKVVGKPPPYVTWLKDGHPLDEPRVRYVADQDFILINNVSRHDSGTYTCSVSQVFENSHLVETASFEVEVTEHKPGANTSGSRGSASTPLVVSMILLVVLLVSMVIAGGLIYYKRRNASSQLCAGQTNAHRGSLSNLASPSDKQETAFLYTQSSAWELLPDQLKLRDLLGTGAFGEVWRATLSALKETHNPTTVAVKKLKKNSSAEEKQSLRQEIELGQSLGGDTHPHIMNFIGCVTTSCDAPLMLVMEYVPYGDLLGYLRKTRGIDDKYYNCAEDCKQEVTSYDLLSFCQQIASGMSFLADKKILHRDLAARNILVGEGKICKITDFGLALIRDKYQYIYCTAIKKGRLPVKWTAPEHLFDENNVRVSEKSDVWSYGIVLYEIFTLGGVPYPQWNEWKVVYELKVNKYRMERPNHVSQDLYQVMLDCWNEDSTCRPSFDHLYGIMTDILEERHYIEVDMSEYEGNLYAPIDDISRTIKVDTLPSALLREETVSNEDTPQNESEV